MKGLSMKTSRRRMMLAVFSLLMVGMLLLSACASAPAAVEPTAVPAEPTAVPAEPTAAPVEPTAAPVEPTAEPTAEPTKVPEATATQASAATETPAATETSVATATVAASATVAATATKAAVTAPTATQAAAAAPSGEWEPRQLSNIVLRGSGATFPNPLYQVWISVYTKNIVPGVQISYQSVGSGQGQRDFIAYLTDFGGSDSAVSSNTVNTQAPDAIHIPMVLGGVMPMYNLPSVKTTLRFSAESIVGIYFGSIKKWNDPRIAADNPGVELPDIEVIPVYRSDSSGTTSIFTNYLSSVSGDWKSQVGAGNTVKWPAGIGAPGNAGVSSTVQRTEGAVGYVEVGYALAAGFPLPFVKNQAGNYVKPETANVSAAASGRTLSSDPQKLAMSIVNGPAAEAYPIAGYTYILVRKDTYKDVEKAQALSDFIYWGLTIGQGATVRLGYAPLPEDTRKAAMKALMAIRVNGQQVLDAPVR